MAFIKKTLHKKSKKFINKEVEVEPKIKERLDEVRGRTLAQVLGEGKVLDKDFGVIHNPTSFQISHGVDKSKYHEMRALYHPVHGVFAWPSENATHQTIKDKLCFDHGYSNTSDASHLYISKHKKDAHLVAAHYKDNYGDLLDIPDHPSFKGISGSKSVGDYSSHSVCENNNEAAKIFNKLETLAEKNELETSILIEVFLRGVDTWNDNVKITCEQFAFNRVHSFLNGGNAYLLDEDLLTEAFIRKMQIRTGILSGAAREVFGDSLAARTVYDAEHKIHTHLNKGKHEKEAAAAQAHHDKKQKEKRDERHKESLSHLHDKESLKTHHSVDRAVKRKAEVANKAKEIMSNNKKEREAARDAKAATAKARSKPDKKPLEKVIKPRLKSKPATVATVVGK
ncbi:MAG: hypothetical protein P4L79_10770 [Legionella sp.]|uniref:hypothetical protein n=1 Tax=Legionella sp. TaxID=459 RepID=UPI00283CADA2|nr:hypothetical protein [Legionella sp.]